MFTHPSTYFFGSSGQIPLKVVTFILAKSISASLMILPLILLLSGCGQPGPLYLPGQKPPIHVEPTSASTPEAKSEKTP